MCLSVQQPYAGAIASGLKDVENRAWRTTYQPGGLIAVHASARPEWLAPEEAWLAAGVAPYRPGMRRADWEAFLPLGAIVAVATFRGCHRDEDFPMYRPNAPRCSRWAVPCAWHWVLEQARPLPEPVPHKGRLGLRPLPGDVEIAVRAQLEAARA
jgi:hypothetical protein